MYLNTKLLSIRYLFCGSKREVVESGQSCWLLEVPERGAVLAASACVGGLAILFSSIISLFFLPLSGRRWSFR